MHVRPVFCCALALCAAWSCANPPPELAAPPFDAQSIESSGAEDPDVANAVDAAVAVARDLGFYYDASHSEDGLVTVIAHAHGEPVTLTIRFLKQESTLVVADAMTQSAGAALQDAGRYIEKQFFDHLAVETQQRGLGVLPHLAESP
jgi:hypothetical protein